MRALKAKHLEGAPHANADKRLAGRRSVRREGWLRTRDGTIHGVLILDVSVGGVGIAMLVAHALTTDDVVELSVDAPEAFGDSWLPCVVKWRVRDRLGLAFQASATEAFLASLAERPWDGDE